MCIMPFQTNIFANIPLNNLAERILCHTLNITEKHDIHYNGDYALNNSYNACAPKIYPYFLYSGQGEVYLSLISITCYLKK